MPETTRRRIDYMPGPAAQGALDRAAGVYPELRLQALIDKLVICGLSALTFDHWTPPALHGKNRDLWPVDRASDESR